MLLNCCYCPYIRTILKYVHHFANIAKKILLFISRHEYSIYVWHLLLINKIVGYSPIYMTVRNNCPKLCFIIVFIIAMAIPYFIDLFVSSIDYNQVKKQIINLR